MTDLVDKTQDSTETIVKRVQKALADPRCAGIRFRYTYKPAGGPGMPVTPPAGHLNEKTSPRSKELKPVEEQPGLFEFPDGSKGVTINTYGAQANRFEAAIAGVAEEIGYPVISVAGADKTEMSNSLQWPHRHADIHWRLVNQYDDTDAGERRFDRKEYEAIRAATPGSADALLRWFPASCLYGWWHSQTGGTDKAQDAVDKAQTDLERATKENEENPSDVHRRAVERARQALATATAVRNGSADGFAPGPSGANNGARFGRVVSSQILARKVTVLNRLAARIDPFGSVSKSSGWAKLGANTIPPSLGIRDVTADEFEGFTFISFTQLRNLRFAKDEGDARLLLTLLAVLAVILSENDGHIRSGADLVIVPDSRRCELLINGRGPETLNVGLDDATAVKKAVKTLGRQFGWEPITVSTSPRYTQLSEEARTHSAKDEKEDEKK